MAPGVTNNSWLRGLQDDWQGAEAMLPAAPDVRRCPVSILLTAYPQLGPAIRQGASNAELQERFNLSARSIRAARKALAKSSDCDADTIPLDNLDAAFAAVTTTPDESADSRHGE